VKVRAVDRRVSKLLAVATEAFQEFGYDATSMELIAERAASAYAETIEATTSIQVFGAPTDVVTEMLRQQAGAGVPSRIKPNHLGGFTR